MFCPWSSVLCMQLPRWISTMTYVIKWVILTFFKPFIAAGKQYTHSRGKIHKHYTKTTHFMYSTTPYKFIHAWILPVVHLAIISFSLTEIYFFSIPAYSFITLPIPSIRNSLSIVALLFTWPATAQRAFQVWSGTNMQSQSSKQPQGPSLFRGTACYVDLTNIWVDTKAKSTQRAVSLRLNLWRGSE